MPKVICAGEGKFMCSPMADGLTTAIDPMAKGFHLNEDLINREVTRMDQVLSEMVREGYMPPPKMSPQRRR